MVHFFHEGGGPYLKGENPLTPSSISNARLIDGVPPLSANGPLRFIRIIYMGQAHKSNKRLVGGQCEVAGPLNGLFHLWRCALGVHTLLLPSISLYFFLVSYR